MSKMSEARHIIGDTAVYCAFDEVIDINELKENPKNPNTHSKEQIELLAEVIKKTGWRAAITVSKLSGLIVKGHGRLQAAKKAGFKEVPIEYQNFTDEAEEMAALLADNKIAELAEIDNEKLKEIFGEFEFDELLLTGYSQEEYEELASAFKEYNMKDCEIEMPELATGDKELFQQMTFTLADAQAELIKRAISEIKKTDAYKNISSFGNENTNGNALYCIAKEWLNE